MIFVTAMAIGFSAGMMRSVLAFAITAIMIVLVYSAASLISIGSVPLLSLLMAILGYNSGIIALIGGMLAVQSFRPAPHNA